MSRMSLDCMKAEYLKELQDNPLDVQLVNVLHKKFQQFSSIDHDKHAVVDQVLRDHLLNFLTIKTLQKGEMISAFEVHLNICIEACKRDMCSPTMPILLLGDIFDTSTLDVCEKLFSFVERNVNVWKEEMFFTACKNNLLRMCNDLLRRLSRSQNTVFCGRILLFLAKFFSFSERSGLNIISEFNLENVTEYSTTSFEKMDVQEDAEAEVNNKLKVDFNLYTKFWALQDYFRNPTLCYNKVQWKTFTSYCSCVLTAFKNFKLDDINVSKDSLSMSIESQLQGQHYFAKFLTNQKLLELELSDVNFRRYILVQCLILFQYLTSPVKFKMDNAELKPDQLDWIKTITEQVYSLLHETPPDGVLFVETIKHIFQREEHWNNWKNEGCAEFKKPEPPAVMDEKSDFELTKNRTKKTDSRLLGDIIKGAAEKKQFYLGNSELDKLWNHAADNLESCKAKQRDFLPSIESYFEEAAKEADPSLMIEDQYKKVNDGNFGWRALRLLARRSPYFFVQSNNPINTLPEYLDIMIKKIFKERHTKVHVVDGVKTEPEQENTNTVEMTETGNMDEDLIKSDDKASKSDQKKPVLVTKEHLDSVASLVANNWRGLGRRLGLQPDEIEFISSQRPTDEERARHLLQLWIEMDDEPLVDDLVYVLEGLEMTAACQLLKSLN
ncbi:unnamed protein product [Bemisia tabaci]|uniref:Death domain-containing protein n=1 Tax=Bemisia tabaci TaxID=7038 RepID=A0A9P0EWH1_BEMTA|nr:unnamed protein product [Bemisia tabaci]